MSSSRSLNFGSFSSFTTKGSRCNASDPSEVLGVGEVAAVVEREAAARRLPTRIEGAGALAGPRWSVASALDEVGFRPTRMMHESLGEVLDYYRSESRV